MRESITFFYIGLHIVHECLVDRPYGSISNKALGGVVYGQYTTAKGCSYARSNTECLDTALSRGLLAIYHKPIAIINWLPM